MRVFTTILLIMLVINLSEAGLFDQQERGELRIYQYRNKILYERLVEENCVDPAITLGRQLNSYTITKMLETEKDLYKQLIEALIVCEKGKLSTKTATPTTSPTTMQMTTTPATTTSATTSEATTQGVYVCSGDYVLNPISNTCIRLVEKYLTYAEAKADCEAAGEYLAVFPTVDSVQWLLNFMSDPKTPSAWRRGLFWYGIYLNEAQGWRWDGRLTDAVSPTDPIWMSSQPSERQGAIQSDGEACGCIHHSYTGLTDCFLCTANRNFICEKSAACVLLMDNKTTKFL